MQPPPLGRLMSVALRDIWPDEAQSFTPWLAKTENLKLLSDTLAMDLEVEDEEVAVGPFSADILCKDTVDGSWVVIENQIEKTDHKHLGQVLTYAAGLGAKTMIWIAAKFTDEHRAAIDWLNDNTGEDISFFGLEMEIWRIANSPPAPKFNIVCKPNDWSKTIRTQAAGTDQAVTPHKQARLIFWTEFKAYVEKNSDLRPSKPGFNHWISFALGRTGFHMAAVISTWNTVSNSYSSPEVRVELVLMSSTAKLQFASLEAKKSEIQQLIDIPIVWHNPEDAKSCKIYVRRDGDFIDRQNWPELFAWLLNYLQRFEEVLGPLVKTL